MKSLVVVALLASVAAAQPTATLAYRVKPKDTLDVIAAEFYGDRQYASFIVAENKLKNGRVQPYSRLKIPVTREITAAPGDAFPALAQTYLGDARRAPVLAEFNLLDVSDLPATGTALLIPFHITHVADNKESLGTIAAQYLDDSKQADLIRRYNFFDEDKTAVEKGETVLVPVVHVRVKLPKPTLDADAKERREEHRHAMADADAALPAARAAWLQGDFARIKTILEPFAKRLEFLDTNTVVQIGLMLGKAYVAYDEIGPATAIFASVLERKTSQRLMRYSDSPKVIEAWKKAGGQLVE